MNSFLNTLLGLDAYCAVTAEDSFAKCVRHVLADKLMSILSAVETKEWVWFVLSFVGVMIGTINIRMAEMRERNQGFLPLTDPSRSNKK